MTRPDATAELLRAVREGRRPPQDLEGICARHFRYGLYSVDGTVRCVECVAAEGKTSWVEKHLDAREGAR